MLTSILHRSLSPNPRDRERRERERLARGLERIDDFARPSRRGPRGLAPIIRADVAAATAPSAAELAATLRDPGVTIDPAVVAEIRRFLTDGCTSELYADSPHDAFLRVAGLASLATPREVARSVVAV